MRIRKELWFGFILMGAILASVLIFTPCQLQLRADAEPTEPAITASAIRHNVKRSATTFASRARRASAAMSTVCQATGCCGIASSIPPMAPKAVTSPTSTRRVSGRHDTKGDPAFVPVRRLS